MNRTCRVLQWAPALGAWLLFGARSLADVRLPGLFSDHMVMQREMPVPVWGWAEAGERISVRIAQQTKETTAGADGSWMVKLDPLTVGLPRTLIVQGKNKVAVGDILVGEVWVASGQSNMGLSVHEAANASAEAAASADPQLRMFTVPRRGDLTPQADAKGRWEAANPDTVPSWTAAGYYFARQLRRDLGVPVGIVHSSYGGTPAEAWTSLTALQSDPTFRDRAAEEIAAVKSFPADLRAFPELMQKWIAAHDAQDPGKPNEAPDEAKPDLDDSGWKRIETPFSAGKLGLRGGGILWLRKSFDFAADAPKNDFDMDGLWIHDSALLYFNGVEVKDRSGAPEFSGEQYRFRVPGALIRPGRTNVVAFRIHALSPQGGFFSRTRELKLRGVDPKQTDNRWAVRVEKEFPPLNSADIAAIPKAPHARIERCSGGLFNAMINPLIPYTIRGVIWYQGESNASRAGEYKRLLTLLIGDWRSRWGEGDFPFLIEQLANYNDPPENPGDSAEARTREAQLQVSQTVAGAPMAVAIDVGEVDIHPKNKQEVGRRLELLALAHVYGKKVACSGPIFQSMSVEGNTIRIHFAQTEGGLASRGGALRRFAIAGSDRKFVWADARIEGDAVVVSSPAIVAPIAVRYAWASNPEGANLYNGAGLPASPFRTDQW